MEAAATCAAGRLVGFGSSRTSSAIFGSTKGMLGSLRLGCTLRAPLAAAARTNSPGRPDALRRDEPHYARRPWERRTRMGHAFQEGGFAGPISKLRGVMALYGSRYRDRPLGIVHHLADPRTPNHVQSVTPNTNRVRFPAKSLPVFRMWESCRTTPTGRRQLFNFLETSNSEPSDWLAGSNPALLLAGELSIGLAWARRYRLPGKRKGGRGNSLRGKGETQGDHADGEVRNGFDFRWGHSHKTRHWSAGFLGEFPVFPPTFHSGAAPYSSRLTLVGSQNLDVKSLSNLSPSTPLCLKFLPADRRIAVDRAPAHYTRKSGFEFPLKTWMKCGEWRGRGGAVVRLLASHQGEPGSIPGGLAHGVSHVSIVPEDGAGRRVFLGDLPFLPPLYYDAAPFSPLLTLIGSQDLDVDSRPNLSILYFSPLAIHNNEKNVLWCGSNIKSQRQNWPEEAMGNAVTAFLSDSTEYSKSAELFIISQTTLELCIVKRKRRDYDGLP
ncbi:hypothetical protein PR048_027562 [Dryococelus australis]|uniref:Ribosomal protein L2 n=1 Tax=Dryococelus australis TaxID=614101 RepID=A0ABQ9GGW7_9NEOP|nr:hypothetical protein PR048_027562 [Dryococelus australis]